MGDDIRHVLPFPKKKCHGYKEFKRKKEKWIRIINVEVNRKLLHRVFQELFHIEKDIKEKKKLALIVCRQCFYSKANRTSFLRSGIRKYWRHFYLYTWSVSFSDIFLFPLSCNFSTFFLRFHNWLRWHFYIAFMDVLFTDINSQPVSWFSKIKEYIIFPYLWQYIGIRWRPLPSKQVLEKYISLQKLLNPFPIKFYFLAWANPLLYD